MVRFGGAATPAGQQSAAHQDPLLRRVNGRPQACDPCRRRKVACDNLQPVCNRCRKRKQGDRCVYTFSEQTSRLDRTMRRQSARPADTVSSSQSSPIEPASSLPAIQPSLYSEPEYQPLTQEDTGARNERAFTDNPILRRTRVQHGGRSSLDEPTQAVANAYVGFFSYSTSFDEARTSLSLLNGGRDVATSSDITPPIRSASRQPTQPGDRLSNLGAVNREMCLHILRNLPNPTSKALRPLGLFPAQLWSRVATSRVLQQLERQFGHVLATTPRDDDKLQAIAERICANSAKPFDGDLVDPDEFLDQFAGPDLRWESLGLLFTFRELAPDVNGSNTVLPPEALGRSHDVWPEAARACLRLCIELAKSFTEGNVILSFLYLRLINIDALVFGDSSVTYWITNGEAVALATSIGLHALPDPPGYKPCLASEVKRRIAAYLFNLDKVGSAFHGRPPLLSHRYLLSPLPLALSDETLLAGSVKLDQAVTFLDADGWNTIEELGSTTLIRCRMLLAYFKDKLLEIALGINESTQLDKIHEIQQREISTYSAFPDKCKYRDEHIEEVHLSVDTLFLRLKIYLEHLQNQLFAARLLARHNSPDDGTLLFYSFEIVRHVLIFWLHNARFHMLDLDFISMAMSYGAPGGGVLCMELLFPTLPNRPIPYTNATSPRITRSAIIQQLSLLVGFLSWAGPSAPHTDANQAASCKAIVQCVLDYTLNSSTGMDLHDGDSSKALLFESIEPGQLDFGFDHLGTFDWFRPEKQS